MNFSNIFSEIEKVDPEVYDRLDSRRGIFKNFGETSKKLTLAALPFALGGMLQKAYGQTTTGVAGVLNFALTLEYLEYNFYASGLSANIVPAGASAALAALTKIRDHELQHVNFLKNTITAAGATPITPLTAANFDFTAKGAFSDVFTNYDTFLAVAQALEDTGVRAYKGQAGNLMGTANRGALTAALNIHSVEARHASHIRQMRFARSVAVKPWITGVVSGIPAGTTGNYAGEDATSQLGVNIATLPGAAASSTIGVNAATESFDEPLTQAQVTALVTPFFK